MYPEASSKEVALISQLNFWSSLARFDKRQSHFDKPQVLPSIQRKLSISSARRLFWLV